MRKASKRGDTGADALRQAISEVDSEIMTERWQKAMEEVLDGIRDRERIVATVDYATESVDPLGGYQTYAPRQTATVKNPPTEKQIALLVNLGVKPETAQGYSKGQAGAVINSLKDQRCSSKQAKTLERYGYDPSEHNYHSASEVIDRLAANGWQKGGG